MEVGDWRLAGKNWCQAHACIIFANVEVNAYILHVFIFLSGIMEEEKKLKLPLSVLQTE